MGAFVSKHIGVQPRLPAPLGQFHVGFARFRVPDGGPLCKAFYPCRNGGDPDLDVNMQNKKYTRWEAVEGLAKTIGKPSFVFANLVNAEHRLNVGDAPLHEQDGELPLVIFSHGLKGSSDMYSKVCSDIASLGFIVIAVETEDGSASFARDQKGKRLTYIDDPPGLDLTDRAAVVNFRAPFLKHRKSELERIFEFVQGKSFDNIAPVADFPRELVAKVLNLANTEELFIGGHSFGSAATVYSLSDSESVLAKSAKGAFLLDLWPVPLDPSIVERGIAIPCLSIITREFSNLWHSAITTQLVENSTNVKSYLIEGTTHQQYSDTPFYFTDKLAIKSKAKGETALQDSQRVLIKSIADFMGAPLDLDSAAESANTGKLLLSFPEPAKLQVAAGPPSE